MKAPMTLTFLSLNLALGACSSPSGPVAPDVVTSPSTPVWIHPELQAVVGVPNAAQTYSWTQDGLLKYEFQLQNRTAEQVTLRYSATFFDEGGLTVDDQKPMTLFLRGFETKPVSSISANPKSRKATVQVLPAR